MNYFILFYFIDISFSKCIFSLINLSDVFFFKNVQKQQQYVSFVEGVGIWFLNEIEHKLYKNTGRYIINKTTMP
uniref:Uncharacterized protein n=1 Tax=Octopus bimaculoides TaxID=37653 RepID=A0A0L8I8U0_OCTBM